MRQVGVAEAIRLADERRIIDVREEWEWNEGHIPQATLLPLGQLARIAELVPDPRTPLLLHCRSGARSGRAAAWLAAQGYSDVVNLAGKIAEWPLLGGEWTDARGSLSDAERARYARQIAIPEIGEEGQKRLLDAKLLLVGAGGLGSGAALYLAAAGVGTIGLVDDDVVDESNLQRQVLHASDRIGMAKTDSGRRSIASLNPATRVVEHRERLEAANAERLIGAYDVVLDGTDNLDARYALNDAAVRLRKTVVHGSVHRWEGQVTTFVPFVGPCYRCLHPTQPPDELAPDCSVAGVVGVLPGIVGLLQASEALKLLLGVGETLAGRLLMFDALAARFEELRFARDPACPACGEGSAAAAG